jgi:hypothetical protein
VIDFSMIEKRLLIGRGVSVKFERLVLQNIRCILAALLVCCWQPGCGPPHVSRPDRCCVLPLMLHCALAGSWEALAWTFSW